MKSPMDCNDEPPPSSVFIGSVYKSLRWSLCDLLLRLGNSDAHDPAERLPLLDDLESVLYLLERYRDHEERRVYPIVEEVQPTAVQRLLLQHREQDAAIAYIRQLASDAEQGGENPSSTIEHLYLQFSRFVASTLAHLYDEETLTTQALSSLHDSAFVAQVQSSILNDMGPDERALFRRALLPSTRPTWRKHVGLGR